MQLGGPIWKDHLFFFSDYQGTRQVRGAETGLVTVPTTDQRAGNFDPSALTGTIDGPYWAQVLSQRLGYPVTQGEQYSFVGCTTTTQCVLPGWRDSRSRPGHPRQATFSRTFPRPLCLAT